MRVRVEFSRALEGMARGPGEPDWAGPMARAEASASIPNLGISPSVRPRFTRSTVFAALRKRNRTSAKARLRSAMAPSASAVERARTV